MPAAWGPDHGDDHCRGGGRGRRAVGLGQMALLAGLAVCFGAVRQPAGRGGDELVVDAAGENPAAAATGLFAGHFPRRPAHGGGDCRLTVDDDRTVSTGSVETLEIHYLANRDHESCTSRCSRTFATRRAETQPDDEALLLRRAHRQCDRAPESPVRARWRAVVSTCCTVLAAGIPRRIAGWAMSGSAASWPSSTLRVAQAAQPDPLQRGR